MLIHRHQFSVALLIGAAALLFASPPASAEILVKDGQKVAFMGDSITQGGWGNPGGYVRLVIAGLEANGVKVTPVAGDMSTEEGRAAALAACPNPDILVNNNGGPPRGDFREWDREAWIKAVDGNMLTPIELIKATIDGMASRGFGRIVNITSSAVKAPIDVLGLSNGARSGLTGFIAGLSRAVVKHNVTINNMLPGVFDTDRIRSNFEFKAKERGATLQEMYDERLTELPAGRFGTPAEFGDCCAYLCSVQAGYITGQTLHVNGGMAMI